ncbi:hypothetical protein ACTMTJ_30075 [Phytohabitans sp. LJ34]|uniref:hypothetical protein n=1 Tax=Phytohabitans sp. LJ34 TaxID=3452217 RepID=UPI003F8B277D
MGRTNPAVRALRIALTVTGILFAATGMLPATAEMSGAAAELLTTADLLAWAVPLVRAMLLGRAVLLLIRAVPRLTWAVLPTRAVSLLTWAVLPTGAVLVAPGVWALRATVQSGAGRGSAACGAANTRTAAGGVRPVGVRPGGVVVSGRPAIALRTGADHVAATRAGLAFTERGNFGRAAAAGAGRLRKRVVTLVGDERLGRVPAADMGSRRGCATCRTGEGWR